jgi:hypothetical protein
MPERRNTQKSLARSRHSERKGCEFAEGVAERLLAAGEQAGLTGHDLVALLESGMSLGDLMDYLCHKLQGRPTEN